MINPNPEDPNVPNEDVPEEDPEMDIEEEEPEEEPVEEPEPLPGHGDQFNAHPNPQPGNMNGWVDNNVDIEEDDDAEIIFLYEVQGDQTPPPRDESSDSEFEAEEADDELGLRRLTMSLRLRRSLLNLKFRRLVMSRRRVGLRIMPPKQMTEARMRQIIRDQFATSMNEFMADMNSRAGGPGGASGSGGAGGSGGTGGNANGTGVRGTGPTVPELTGCTYATFIKCDPLPFIGTEGAVGLCQWFERLELVFQISECKEKDRVKFAMDTLRGRALTWWNGRTKAMGIEAANNTPWSEVKKWMTHIHAFTEAIKPHECIQINKKK
nr:putative reverse transcriptase domain-containing protein [Tanacetum cinerariifolium]